MTRSQSAATDAVLIVAGSGLLADAISAALRSQVHQVARFTPGQPFSPPPRRADAALADLASCSDTDVGRLRAWLTPAGAVTGIVPHGTRRLSPAPADRLVASGHDVCGLLSAALAIRDGRPGPRIHAPQPVFADPEVLTERETEILQLLADGLRNDDVAGRLGISPHTVRTHLQNIHTKLGVRTRLAAVAQARQAGLISAPRAV